MALGADVVGIGTTAVYAVAHNLLHKTLPYEPPIELIGEGGRYRFDPEQGAHLENFLTQV